MPGSVTQRIREIKQPRDGIVKLNLFTITQLEDGKVLGVSENINAGLVGMAVDYLTRYLMGTPKEAAFLVSVNGARLVMEESNADKLLARIKGLDKRSIDAACKLTGYDVCCRAGVKSFRPVNLIKPDGATCENIRIMVKRSLLFWKTHGPIVKDGFEFEGAYTDFIYFGDGDFLTKDTLWNFKVSKFEPKTGIGFRYWFIISWGKNRFTTNFLLSIKSDFTILDSTRSMLPTFATYRRMLSTRCHATS